LTDDGKPDDRVDVFRHDDESDAFRLAYFLFLIENAQKNSLGLIVIQEFPPAINGKGVEMQVKSIIDNPTLCHSTFIAVFAGV
jgi:hypothetical protein